MAFLVYMTAASADEAERIAGDLVESRLAACVNVMAPIRSVYSWKGELCRSEEIPFIAKTDDDRFEALAARVRALHSYETPLHRSPARGPGGMRIFSLGSPNQHIRRNDVHLCRRLAGFRPYHVL